MVAAGDIACDPEMVATSRSDLCQSDATAQLIEALAPAAVLTLGDNQYKNGDSVAFEQVYETTWGRFKARTYPSVGNHDYYSGGEGYFSYFGARAGEPSKGYYSFDLGAWHLIALNSNCSEVGGCGADSEQGRWLSADLAAHGAKCTLAFWHHPRFSSGSHGDSSATAELFTLLYKAGAELVLSGHDHHYERFAPQAPNKSLDPDRGVTQFVVGTGGRSLRPTLPTLGSQKRYSGSFGVLKLELRPASYTWTFVSVEETSFSDSGTANCH